MTIEKEQLNSEQKKLKDTEIWIKDELDNIKNNDKLLQEKIASLKKQSKGRYSEELEITQKLYEIIQKNLESYSEAKIQPYFAKIDFREYRKEKESYYIGKFGLNDSKTGEEIVIDWRAPIADLYYSGTQGEVYYKAPIGIINGELSLKRKFQIKEGKLKDAFDEGINELILNSGSEEGKELIDEFLKLNLEESVSSKLKEVVATIQKEQNDIIRADKNNVLIVQGSAGSGKTTIALHRLAYLIYKYKNKLNGDNILVIAPNKLFLDYISEVLPNLGVDRVKQKTFEEVAIENLNLKGKLYTKDKKLAEIIEAKDSEAVKFLKNSSKLKGLMSFKIILDRYIRYIEKKDIEISDIKVQNYTLFDNKEIKRLYGKDMQHLPINKRKDEIKRYFNLKLNDKIISILEKIDFSYEYQLARAKKTIENDVEKRKKLIELYDERDAKKGEMKKLARHEFEQYFNKWKAMDVRKLMLDLFNNREIFTEISGGKIPEPLIEYIVNTFNFNIENGIIDSDDLASMLYLKLKIEGIELKDKYEHIVIDEAQDYSPLQLYILKNMVHNNSLTVVGDIGQGIYYYKGISDWGKVVTEVFDGDAIYSPLTQSYRSTVEIIEFANSVLKKQQNSLKPAMPVLRHGKIPQIIEYNTKEVFAEYADNVVQEVGALGKKSVAIVGRTLDECKTIQEVMKKYSKYSWDLIKDTDKTINLDKLIIPVYLTKGLEFDCTVVYNCSEKNYGENELDKKLLYVALTRALHLEYVFYSGVQSTLIEE